MTTEFLLQLGAVFTIISGIIVTILKYNSDRFKSKVDDDSVKRKEVSELLQKLYDDTRSEIQELKKLHREEMGQAKQEHRDEIARMDIRHAEEIRKRDIIITELISRLPKEAKEAVENKMKEIHLTI